MKRSVKILSCKAATDLIEQGGSENAAVISFYDPKSSRSPAGYTPIYYNPVCRRVFYSVLNHSVDHVAPASSYTSYFDFYDVLLRLFFLLFSIEYLCLINLKVFPKYLP